MREETRLEVVKALAYGEAVEDIANMAEVDVEEIERLRKECADEISERQKAIEGGAGDGV